MPATPGRPETPNRREARSILKERFPDWHPFVQLCETAQDEDETRETRFAAAKEVTAYLMPKLKSVEVTGDGGGAIHVLLQTPGDGSL